MSTAAEPKLTERLQSIDAYRGFVMLAMASSGFHLARVAGDISEGTSLWDVLAFHTEHVRWRGCSFWDLIQPSFMFLVGVSLPFSNAKRMALGQSWARRFAHAVGRSIVLIALGVFLSSHGRRYVNFTFVNVLTQIGLGYTILFLLAGLRPWVQLATAGVILVGYWGLFAAYPLPAANFDWRTVGVAQNWQFQSGFAAHWEKNWNPAAAFDRWFINIWPHPDNSTFRFNSEGYCTLNFVPSLATMIFGLLAGQWLRTSHTGKTKLLGLFLVGGACLILGTALEPICPVVKKIWTPSWTIYSTAWTCWFLAAFYGAIDLAGYKRWAWPLVVVGMNSIAIYCMAQLLPGWIERSIRAHVDTLFFWLDEKLGLHLPTDIFGGTYGPIAGSAAVLMVLWLACYWLYRRKIFLRI